MVKRLMFAGLLALAAAAPSVAEAQPLPGPAWCPMPSIAPVGGWYFFVPCGWVPTRHPWIYSTSVELPYAGYGNVWFTVGNHNPYVPRIDVPMPPMWDTGKGVFYDGCSEALAAFVDWFSIGSFTASVAAPDVLGPAPPPAPVSVGMSGICPY